MLNPEHLEILSRGVEEWNQWRKEKGRTFRPHLPGADLRGADLAKANLRDAFLAFAHFDEASLISADLSTAYLDNAKLPRACLANAYLHQAILRWADLTRADLRWADLSEADLRFDDLERADLFEAILDGADLSDANLSETDLRGASLIGANLSGVDLRGADLRGADLRMASLVGTHLEGTDLCAARVWGVSAWNVATDEKTQQTGLIITPEDEPEIVVDDLKVAQFVYLLLDNEEIRDVIDTITSKVVLVLGNFSEERKAVLDALREELRERRGYVPVLFDFEKPASKTATGTVATLARMARFIIADLTDPSSVPHELATVVPQLTRTAVHPIRLQGATGYGMFEDLLAYPWVLEPYEYESPAALIGSLGDVLAVAEERVIELRGE